MLNIYKLQKNNQTLKLLDCPFYRALICILFSYQRPFLERKKFSFFAFQVPAKKFSLHIYQLGASFFQKTYLPLLFNYLLKKLLQKLLKELRCFYLYHTFIFLSSIFSKLKSYTILFKICQVLFFFCTFFKKFLKRSCCNSDLQRAYLYHTFKILSSTFFILYFSSLNF